MWTSDGSEVTQTLWDATEPDGATTQNCGAMDNAKKRWDSGWCDFPTETKIPVVCEKTSKYTIYHETKQTYEWMELDLAYFRFLMSVRLPVHYHDLIV